MNETMAAEVTVVFKVPNVIGRSDLEGTGKTFEEMVRYLIAEEGLFGVVDMDEWWRIVEVKEWRS